MSQPENIQNSTFNSSNFLINTQYLLFSSINEIENSFEIPDIAKDVLTYSKNYLKSKDVETINNFISSICNQYCVKVDDSITVENVTNKINDYYKDNSNLYATFTREQLLSNSVISNDISQAYALALAFPLIFCVVAILVVLTTISQLILKQRMQIGTMKALGFSKRQILFNYISFMCGVSLVGVILGLIIGPLLLPNVLNIKYNLLYALPAQQYNFPWLIAIIIVVAVLVLVSLLTYLLIRKELSLTPANSMRPATPNVKLKTRKSFLKDPFIRMALRNIKVHFTKTIMIIIGVLGCTGLLICGFGIDDSINYGKDYDMKNFYGADITVNYTSNNTTLKDKILAIDGVNSVDEYSTLSSQVDNN